MRNPGFAEVIRLLRLAEKTQATNQSSEHAVESSRDARRVSLDRRKSRRDFIVESSRLAALAAGASMLDPSRAFASGSSASSLERRHRRRRSGRARVRRRAAAQGHRRHRLRSVDIASAGVAIRCAERFPGQVAERGGEFIDNPHKTMLRYAKELEAVAGGCQQNCRATCSISSTASTIDESEIVDAVPRLRAGDAGRPAAVIGRSRQHSASTPDDRAIDRTEPRGVPRGSNGARCSCPAACPRAAIEEAYKAEYGLEPDEQSALNFLMFIHADRRSKFTPFGVSSDERWHIVEGNDRIPSGLAARCPDRRSPSA